MKKTILILCALIIVVFFNTPVFAECTPGTSWTASWTDEYGQTTYTLEAPCKVYIGIPFTVIATVTDNAYPNDSVACLWSISDNGSVIARDDSRVGWLDTVNGQWQRILEITYTENPVDHIFEFYFVDLGQGGGAHFWGTRLIGGLTVDPYPPAANMPPTVEAGQDIFLASEDQITTIIPGTAYDGDGNPLTYQWLEGADVLQASRAVDESGSALLNLSAVPPLSIGAHTFTLEVSDGVATVTDTVVVSVENSPPVVAPSGGATVQMWESIVLRGNVADYDGDTLYYKWMEGSMVLAEGALQTFPFGRPVPLPEHVISGGLSFGSHTLTLWVSDRINTVSANMTVNVVDTTSPTLAPTASTTILWPPTGNMTEVAINANARDNSGGPVLLSVLVSGNQPPRIGKDGNAVKDYSIVSIDQRLGVIMLQLSTARPGQGEDRIYSVTVTATDASGNSANAEVLIKAPHDRGGREAGSQVSRGLGRGLIKPHRK